MKKKDIDTGTIFDKTVTAALTEYQQLRAESRDMVQRQNTMLMFIITSLGVVLGIGVNMYIGISESKADQKAVMVACVFCLLIPGLMAFLGSLWLDNVYRMAKIAAYCSLLERKINGMLEAKNDAAGSAMYWEQWNYEGFKRLPFRGNHYQYFIGLGLFMIGPPSSIAMGLFITGLGMNHVIPMLGVLFIAAFWLFAAAYIVKSLNVNKKISE
ncbi:MAG: hypothetical protein FWG42_02200 [Clostridiales bacterium]|nr:hypothetical protein [Clostridiales bacterium]